MRGHQASEYLEGRAVPQCHAVGPAGGDTAPHLSRRDEDVVGVGLVVVCFVAGHDARTGPMVTSLSWHSRSLAEDRLGETGGQPSGALAGVSEGRLVTGGAVAMD